MDARSDFFLVLWSNDNNPDQDVTATMARASLYSDKERAALKWTDELTLIADSGASREAFEGLKPHFSDEEIPWLILAAVQINSWNRIAISTRAQY